MADGSEEHATGILPAEQVVTACLWNANAVGTVCDWCWRTGWPVGSPHPVTLRSVTVPLIAFVFYGLQLIHHVMHLLLQNPFVLHQKWKLLCFSCLCGYFTFVLLVFHRFLRQNMVLHHRCISMYVTVLW